MNRRELIRGAAVVAAAAALPAVAQPVSVVWHEAEWISYYDKYVERWYKVYDYLIAYSKQYYGVDEQHEDWPEVEKLARGLVEYNFDSPEIV